MKHKDSYAYHSVFDACSVWSTQTVLVKYNDHDNHIKAECSMCHGFASIL